MDTQTRITQTILDGGGDYVLALKQNWPATFTEAEALFASPPRSPAMEVHRTIDSGARLALAVAADPALLRCDVG